MGAPLAVRKDMDDWNFDRAMARIEQSTRVYEALTEADRLLPEAELLPIVQPQFEAAGNEDELDAVTEWAESLLDGATQVVGPLGDLSDALPPGWNMPAAVTSALAEQRFDDIRPAISPAIAAAQYISEGNEFLPQAGLLDKYKARFENTTTAAALDELTADARADSLQCRTRQLRPGPAPERGRRLDHPRGGHATARARPARYGPAHRRRRSGSGGRGPRG